MPEEYMHCCFAPGADKDEEEFALSRADTMPLDELESLTNAKGLSFNKVANYKINHPMMCALDHFQHSVLKRPQISRAHIMNY